MEARTLGTAGAAPVRTRRTLLGQTCGQVPIGMVLGALPGDEEDAAAA